MKRKKVEDHPERRFDLLLMGDPPTDAMLVHVVGDVLADDHARAFVIAPDDAVDVRSLSAKSPNAHEVPAAFEMAEQEMVRRGLQRLAASGIPPSIPT